MTAAPFRVLCADPPWRFGDNLPGKGRGCAKHYATLSLAEICGFPLPPLADDSHLFLWKVSAMPQEALDVAKAWGFTVKSEIVWVKRTRTGKRHFGMGRQVRLEHEVALICTRGRARVRSRSIRSVFEATVGRHSEKPEAFYDLVESLCAGPYAELFARRQRPGWACFGNEVAQPRRRGAA